MILLINEEKIRKANEIVVYGKSLPNEVWDLIKEFNNWTDKERERRNQDALDNIYNSFSHSKSYREGRIAPPVKIGDEVCDGNNICGRVVKINKKSIDIERYSMVLYQQTFILGEVTVEGEKIFQYLENYVCSYKWKRNITVKKRLIGSYQLGDNGGGFDKCHYKKVIMDLDELFKDFYSGIWILPTKVFYNGLWETYNVI